jgi:hypothetical protein
MVSAVEPMSVKALPTSLMSVTFVTWSVAVPAFLIWTLNVLTSPPPGASPSAEPRFGPEAHAVPTQSMSGRFGRLLPVIVTTLVLLDPTTVICAVWSTNAEIPVWATNLTLTLLLGGTCCPVGLAVIWKRAGSLEVTLVMVEENPASPAKLTVKVKIDEELPATTEPKLWLEVETLMFVFGLKVTEYEPAPMTLISMAIS